MNRKQATRSLASLLGLATITLGSVNEASAIQNDRRYDHRIEEAAIEMLLPKLGELRGSLDLQSETHLFPPLSQRLVDSDGYLWPAPKGGTGRVLFY